MVSLRSERLKLYIEAERAILAGAQSYELEGRSLTRADLGVIRRAIDQMLDDGVTLEQEIKKRRWLRAVMWDE